MLQGQNKETTYYCQKKPCALNNITFTSYIVGFYLHTYAFIYNSTKNYELISCEQMSSIILAIINNVLYTTKEKFGILENMLMPIRFLAKT